MWTPLHTYMSFFIVIPSTCAFVLSVKITGSILNLEWHDAFKASSVTALALCFNFLNYSVTESMQGILILVKFPAVIEIRQRSSKLKNMYLFLLAGG